jgi:hypothetical protein
MPLPQLICCPFCRSPPTGRGGSLTCGGCDRGRTSPENPSREGEKALGLNEHVHGVWAYVSAFRRARLTIRRMERPDGRQPRPYGTLLAKIPKVGLTPGTLAHLSAARYAGVSIYARRR